jgi:hypothetical protein
MGRKFKDMQTEEQRYAASRQSTPQQTPAAMLQRADDANRKANELNTQTVLNKKTMSEATLRQNKREIQRLRDESWNYGVLGRRARRDEQEAAERKTKRRWF